eukprot:386383_1
MSNSDSLNVTLFFLILTSCNALETIANPGKYSNITCGINEDCEIICTSSCEYSIFYIYNNNIDISCAACDEVTIISSNTSFINLDFTSVYSFQYGKYISDSLDQSINVTCGGTYSCAFATFIYGINQQALHICGSTYHCWGNIIYALGTVSINCEGTVALASYICSSITVFSQTNNLEIAILGPTYANYYTWISIPIIIYITDSSYIPTWNCIGGGCNYQYITYVPGIAFDIDSSCLASDTTCINIMTSTLDTDNTLIISNPINLNFSDYIHDGINDIVIILSNPKSCSTFISPIISASYILSIFCIGCDHITFDLSLTRNVILTNPNSDHLSGSIANSIIYGPTNWFKFNGYIYDALWGDDHDRYNTFYLNNTKHIDILNIGTDTTIYLGDSTNVDIQCNEGTCNYLNIYSSLDASYFTSGDYTFRCQDCTPNCYYPVCTEFYIDFTVVNQRCNYTKYRFSGSSKCNSLVSTSIPTLNILPTCPPYILPIHPTTTITEYPSQPPSGNPSQPPSDNPSQPPSDNPSQPPSDNPSQPPSEYPTFAPTSIPTFYPAHQPTLLPTHIPTSICVELVIKDDISNNYYVNEDKVIPLFDHWHFIIQTVDTDVSKSYVYSESVLTAHLFHLRNSWIIEIFFGDQNIENRNLYESTVDDTAYPPFNTWHEWQSHDNTQSNVNLFIECKESYSQTTDRVTTTTQNADVFPLTTSELRDAHKSYGNEQTNSTSDSNTILLLTVSCGIILTLLCVITLIFYHYFKLQKKIYHQRLDSEIKQKIEYSKIALSNHQNIEPGVEKHLNNVEHTSMLDCKNEESKEAYDKALQEMKEDEKSENDSMYDSDEGEDNIYAKPTPFTTKTLKL